MVDFPRKRTLPGNDVSTDGIDAARAQSRDCPFCGGAGMATIYHAKYDGSSAIRIEQDSRGQRRVLTRTVCYCSCAIGRKLMDMHRQSAKDVYLRTPDIYEITEGKFPEWGLDDPTEREASPQELARLPEGLRRQLSRLREREYDSFA